MLFPLWKLQKKNSNLVASYDILLSKAEKTFFEHFYHLKHCMKQFYINMKIHKNPMAAWVLVQLFLFVVVLSKAFQYGLILKWNLSLSLCLPTFQDSCQVLQAMKDLDELAQNVKLFMANAGSMSTNINTEHSILVFHEWLMDLKDNLVSDFPMSLFWTFWSLSCPTISSNLMICFWEKSTLRQIPAPPNHFAQVEVIFVNEKKEHSANVTGIFTNTNFELTFTPRQAISS